MGKYQIVDKIVLGLHNPRTILVPMRIIIFERMIMALHVLFFLVKDQIRLGVNPKRSIMLSFIKQNA